MSIKVKEIKSHDTSPETSPEESILKFVAEHPEDAFTYIELAKVVGVVPEIKSGAEMIGVLVGAGAMAFANFDLFCAPFAGFAQILEKLVKAGKL